ncbi:hypothetical protein Ddye_017358 [Dipteronia dyeriana]|uniref:Reverse transcriptase domain-containing protein n=1 Tax=Dipteronia dyeriana TaxID=168575 RepID=A0AAD9U911_9ROSI|nr:hypothetical protein Ddye_017358 [Dipteronia dyeriana]
MSCISTVSYSFKLNGKICDDIIPSRGLIQGDPLSPYLFLIFTEGLSSLVQGEQDRGVFYGFKPSRHSLRISHLFFADDSLLFTRAEDRYCETIKRVLQNYFEASGQVINYEKSAVCVSPSVGKTEGKRLADRMGMNLMDCHGKYLGLSCFSGRNKRKLFTDIVDRVWNIIKGWGEKLLSVGGKEVLIKAVIQAILSYTMSIFRLPKGLVDEIQRLIARFWWGWK